MKLSSASSLPLEPPAKWLRPRDAAEYCAVSIETIRRAARAGRLRAVKVGRVLRTTRAWLDEWMEHDSSAGEASVDREHAMSSRGTTAH